MKLKMNQSQKSLSKISKRSQNLAGLQDKINIHFHNEDHLKNAFVHRSYLNEHKNFPLSSNEKLEFLGDSVLSLITSDHLYKNYPTYQEGDYTDMKAAIVNTQSLYEASDRLGLGDFLYLSRGEEDNDGRHNISILADCFEALLGAIYLEFGYETSRSFVLEHLFRNTLDEIIKKKLYMPAKNVLQEYYQDKFKRLPRYEVLEEDGPEHDKVYVVGVFDEQNLLAKGTGKAKKQAEESAAQLALQHLDI